MTGPDQPGRDPAEDRDQAVRALLGEARPRERLPDDVADRLDRTLAGLLAERDAATADPPEVAPLRRRRLPRLLAAAAALVVVAGGTALGIAQLAGSGGHMASGQSASSASVSDRQPPASAGATGSARQGTVGGSPVRGHRPVPRLHADRFRADVARLLSPAYGTALGQDRRDAARAPQPLRPARPTCTRPPGPGRDRLVLLDGRPAVLQVTRTGAGHRVRAYACDGSGVLARATLPH